jgi:hypothetical protein
LYLKLGRTETVFIPGHVLCDGIATNGVNLARQGSDFLSCLFDLCVKTAYHEFSLVSICSLFADELGIDLHVDDLLGEFGPLVFYIID